MLTVDQPQVKGAHVRFKKLVQIGESRFFPLICVGFYMGNPLHTSCCVVSVCMYICCVFDSLLYSSALHTILLFPAPHLCINLFISCGQC